MLFELFLGVRYLKAKRTNAFVSAITIISILGVMVGVMALVVVLSVMNGFRAELMTKILGVNSHLLVLNLEGAFGNYDKVTQEIRGIKGVVATTPFIYSQVMVQHSGNVSGAILRGIEAKSVASVLNIKKMIKEGALTSVDDHRGGIPGVIIGVELSRQLGAYTGDIVTLVSPEGRLTPLGRVPNTRKYRVTAIFDSGMYEYDSSMIFISLKEAQKFLALGNRVTGLEVRVEDLNRTEPIAKAIQKALGYPFCTKDWKLMNKSLFSALKLEKITMFVILAMIVLVGALNIISTLVMVVMEKTKDIAILRAMGASAKSIMSIFMVQGLLVGVVGTFTGLAAGLGICYLLAKYRFITLPSDVYYISSLPVQVQCTDIWLIGVSAVLISFLATLYPSWHASRLNPVEALRYE